MKSYGETRQMLIEINPTFASLPGAWEWRIALRGADLRGANLSEADLSEADLRGANLEKSEGIEIPIIPDIDKAIYAAVTSGGGTLDMSGWHICETTHCRAGWTVVLAGEAGRKLEEQLGTGTAAALIYMKSRPDKPIPNWFADNEEVMLELEEAAQS